MNLNQMLHDIEIWVDKAAAYQQIAIGRNQLEINAKGYATDFVTDVDIKSEQILIECIKEHYPDHSILSEERGYDQQASDYQWLIDPIDGTTNFIHQFPMSSISIALQYKGVTQVGIVYSPWLNMKFHAIKGGGAYLNGKQITASQTKKLEECLLSTGFPGGGHRNYINLDYFSKMIKKVAGIRRTGSAALDLCFVAASYFDGYWEFDLNDWDTCAGILIAEEAGASVQYMQLDNHALMVCSNRSISNALIINLLKKNDG